jgi:hypothetical protein
MKPAMIFFLEVTLEKQAFPGSVLPSPGCLQQQKPN